MNSILLILYLFNLSIDQSVDESCPSNNMCIQSYCHKNAILLRNCIFHLLTFKVDIVGYLHWHNISGYECWRLVQTWQKNDKKSALQHQDGNSSLSFYCSTPCWWHHTCNTLSSFQLKKDIGTLKSIQRRTVKMIRGLEAKLGLSCLSKSIAGRIW